MSWMQTYSCKRFDPICPRAEDIDIRDIAHALSQICRFGGHCREFYSVAQHCVHVAEIVAAYDKAPSDDLRAWALLHDAAEAYVGDIVRPIKSQLYFYDPNNLGLGFLNGYRHVSGIEERILFYVAMHFGLSLSMPAAVKKADDVMLATEAAYFWPEQVGDWCLTEEAHTTLMIIPAAPKDAERMFLSAMEEWLW